MVVAATRKLTTSDLIRSREHSIGFEQTHEAQFSMVYAVSDVYLLLTF